MSEKPRSNFFSPLDKSRRKSPSLIAVSPMSFPTSSSRFGSVSLGFFTSDSGQHDTQSHPS